MLLMARVLKQMCITIQQYVCPLGEYTPRTSLSKKFLLAGSSCMEDVMVVNTSCISCKIADLGT